MTDATKRILLFIIFFPFLRWSNAFLWTVALAPHWIKLPTFVYIRLVMSVTARREPAHFGPYGFMIRLDTIRNTPASLNISPRTWTFCPLVMLVRPYSSVPGC